jgi:hypothetical protein
MFRTILSLVLALVIAVVIGAFQILGLSLADLQALLGSPSLTGDLMTYGGLMFGSLMTPYTMATSSPAVYSPLVALGVAGFVAGLISKSGVRMFFVSIISIVLFFLGFYILTLAGDPSNLDAMYSILKNNIMDIGVAFGLLFIPGVIGASLTAEEY